MIRTTYLRASFFLYIHCIRIQKTHCKSQVSTAMKSPTSVRRSDNLRTEVEKPSCGGPTTSARGLSYDRTEKADHIIQEYQTEKGEKRNQYSGASGNAAAGTCT